MADPTLDPIPPTEVPSPGPSLRANRAFMLLWSAATVSVFGSFVTRIAIPFVAIETLAAGAIEVAILRVVELIAALLVGFVAGAWVDRLRRRKVMIVADVGRALLLGSIPVAAIGGWISLPQVFAVAALAAVLTTFFDVADKAYLPTIVARADLVRANGAIAATSRWKAPSATRRTACCSSKRRRTSSSSTCPPTNASRSSRRPRCRWTTRAKSSKRSRKYRSEAFCDWWRDR